MKICILGWYGSETLGDRSILLGLLKIFNHTFGECQIYLGSINPFFTERCFWEDSIFLNEITSKVKVKIFDSRDRNSLKFFIKDSELVCMGGGPIMDVRELKMIKFAFKFAHKINKKTAILGCGVGPLYNNELQKVAIDLFMSSNLSILRDRNSMNTIKQISKHHKCTIEKPIYYNSDPAIIPVGIFIKKNKKKHQNGEIIMNFRDFPAGVFKKTKSEYLDINFAQFVKSFCKHYEKVVLVPNHNFFLGGDDRLYLAKIKHIAECDNVDVIHRPQNLYELFSVIRNASSCIGMRYHAILFHTFLNGKNALIDYTLPENGKIVSFLEYYKIRNEYENYYINMHNDDFDLIEFSKQTEFLLNKNDYIPDFNIFNNILEIYHDHLIRLFD